MDRTRILKEHKIIDGKKTFVEVSLSYDLGGWNFFTGESEARGIYVNVSPVEKGDGWRSFTAFSGIKMLVKPLKRFNKKIFESFVPEETDVERLLTHVLNKNNITIEQYV